MTASEYQKAYSQARKNWPVLTAKTMRKIKRAYETAADDVAAVLREASLTNKSKITVEAQAELERQLRIAAETASKAILQEVPQLITNGYSVYKEIDMTLILDAVGSENTKITTQGLENMYAGINQKLVTLTASRVWSDGYTFSARAWRVGEYFQKNIKNVLNVGFAENRDLIDIAKDLTTYVKKGKAQLVNRWGDLQRGSKEFAKRIPDFVDARALRLARSELVMSLQDAAKENGRANPASNGLYDWIRLNTIEWGCECTRYAAEGPYRLQDIPSYPHPHCHPEGTLIETKSGQKRIESILPGEFVLSHDGTWNQVTHTWKNQSHGEVLTIETENGSLIRATEEHPFMTLDGWVEAKTLKSGDYLGCVTIRRVGKSLVIAESNDFPPQRSKKGGFFRILSLLSSTGMPAAAIDFNGKFYILESEINAKTPNGKIGERIEANFFQSVIERPLIGRPRLSRNGFSYAGSMFFCLGSTPNGIVCGSCVGFSSSGVGSEKTVSDIWKLESKFNEISTDTPSRNVKHFGYLIDREILVSEQLSEFDGVDCDFSTHNDRIVNVTRSFFKGLLYNLTVDSKNSYIANGFMSHNCVCQVRAQTQDLQVFKDKLRAWVNGAPNAGLDAWKLNFYDPAQKIA